jgi:hypothetical protein
MDNQPKLNKTAFAREVWLNCINNYLFQNGHISEQEHKKIAAKITVFVAKNGKKKN